MVSLPTKPGLELAVDGTAVLKVVREAVVCDRADFDEFERFMLACEPSPNPFRPSTNLLRRQCALLLPSATVASYEFGQRQETRRVDPFAEDGGGAPRLVRAVLESMGDEAAPYDLVQCNYYAHGGVGLSPHRDDEACLDLSHPIVSYSFLKDPTEQRPFAVYTNDDRRLADLHVGHGDAIVMTRDMQRKVKHGIEKERPTKYGPRINLTLRATVRSVPP